MEYIKYPSIQIKMDIKLLNGSQTLSKITSFGQLAPYMEVELIEDARYKG